jgi:thiosulfate dehydrogenase [quinone] large subunit
MAIDAASGTVSAMWVVLIRVAVGLVWLRSGIPKLLGREYLDYREKLERFISGNPYPWYRRFLQDQILPHSLPAGYFFVAAEVLLGLALVLGLFTTPAALIGSFFNLNFRLAAGWSSPSNPPLNYLMIVCQLLIVFSGAGDHLSLDALFF